MAVGTPTSRASVDATSGDLVRSLDRVATQIDEFKAWLDATPDAELTSPAYGYSTEDVALLKSAYNDLSTLIGLYRTQYRQFAGQLAGMGAHL